MNGDQANGTNGADLSIGPSKGAKLLWKHAAPESTPMYQFMKSVNEEFGLQLDKYQDLHRWSIDHIDAFWGHVWKFVGVRAERQSSRVSCVTLLI
jgi:acetoacetyl-CoA synthetase